MKKNNVKEIYLNEGNIFEVLARYFQFIKN